MPWLQLHIDSSRKNADAVEAALLAAGALSVTLSDNADEPIYEPGLGETPLWSDTRVTGLFEADIDTETTLNAIRERCEMLQARWEILEDKDWQREWMSHFHPIQCAEKFWICPSWRSPPDPGAVNLMLDPGLAFGTGTHPTTFMCLAWLAKQRVEKLQIEDYGCGSGILGIGALLLGAREVLGVDIDPQALLATADNVKRNGVAPAKFPIFLPEKAPSDPVDIMLANILAGPLVELAPTLAARIKPGGLICLSGILATQRETIEDAYAPWIQFDHVAIQEEWCCLAGKRHDIP